MTGAGGSDGDGRQFPEAAEPTPVVQARSVDAVASTPPDPIAAAEQALDAPLLSREWVYGQSLPSERAAAGVHPAAGIALRQLPRALPTRLLNVLTREGLTTAEEVAVMPNAELLELHMTGPRSVRIIRAATTSALVAVYARRTATQLPTAKVRELHALMFPLEDYARKDQDHELVQRAQQLRRALEIAGPVDQGERLQPAIETGRLAREEIDAVVGLLAELGLYAGQHNSSETEDAAYQLLGKLAPGFPRPAANLHPDDPRVAPRSARELEPSTAGQTVQPSPALHLVWPNRCSAVRPR